MGSAGVLVVEHQESCPPRLVGDDLPALTSYDAAVVLDGEMSASANDDDTVVRLAPLTAGIRDAVATGEDHVALGLAQRFAAIAAGAEALR